MIRLLVANGDSFTQGSGLSDPVVQAWPARLAELLDTDHVNLARFASPNRRSVRSAVDRLSTLCAERGVAPNEVMVLTAWTELCRHEHYSSTDPADERDHPSDRGWHRLGPWRRGIGHPRTDAFFEHLYSEDGEMAQFFLDWLLFDRYLSSHSYHARYLFTFPLKWPIPDVARKFADQVPADKVWGGLPPPKGRTICHIPADLPRTPDGHLLAEGHAWLASALADWIRLDGAN